MCAQAQRYGISLAAAKTSHSLIACPAYTLLDTLRFRRHFDHKSARCHGSVHGLCMPRRL